MARIFWAIVIYLAIGGALFTPGLIAYERDCNRRVTISQASMMFITWPAWLVAAIFYGDDAKSCKEWPEEEER